MWAPGFSSLILSYSHFIFTGTVTTKSKSRQSCFLNTTHEQITTIGSTLRWQIITFYCKVSFLVGLYYWWFTYYSDTPISLCTRRDETTEPISYGSRKRDRSDADRHRFLTTYATSRNPLRRGKSWTKRWGLWKQTKNSFRRTGTVMFVSCYKEWSVETILSLWTPLSIWAKYVSVLIVNRERNSSHSRRPSTQTPPHASSFWARVALIRSQPL